MESSKSEKESQKSSDKKSKPFFKSWWFYTVIAIIAVIILIYILNLNNESNELFKHPDELKENINVVEGTIPEMNPEDNEKNSGTDDETDNSEEDVEMREEFKEAVDQYEVFMNDYISFMKKLVNPAGTDTSLIDNYQYYTDKYFEEQDELKKWKQEDLNSAEKKYYDEMQSRVIKGLSEINY